MIRAVDPLKLAVRRALRNGEFEKFQYHRGTWGSENSIKDLRCELARNSPHEVAEVVVLDLVPLFLDTPGLAKISEIVRDERSNGRHLIVLLPAETAERPEADLLRDGPFLVVGKDGAIKEREVAVVGSHAVRLRGALSHFQGSRSYAELRTRISHELLVSMLGGRGVRFPDPRAPQGKGILRRAGRDYFRMPNGMIASCYIEMKEVLRSSDALLATAYEVVLALMGYCPSGGGPKNMYDLLVIPNNTALLSGAAVQAIAGIPVCVIDKLGPIVGDLRSADKCSRDVREMRVAVLEEVTATGGELDRASMYLSLHGATVQKAISCFDLGIGRPQLIAEEQRVVLCYPKDELGYEYRSA